MYVLTALYHHPSDPSAFDRHFTEVHAPLLRRVPGLSSVTGHHCDSVDGSAPAYYFMARSEFASRENYERAMSSAEFAKAAEDGPNLAGAGVVLLLTHDD